MNGKKVVFVNHSGKAEPLLKAFHENVEDALIEIGNINFTVWLPYSLLENCSPMEFQRRIEDNFIKDPSYQVKNVVMVDGVYHVFMCQDAEKQKVNKEVGGLAKRLF